MRADWAIGLGLLALGGCTTSARQAAAPPEPCMQIGLASWYRPQGGPLRHVEDALTAAHASLPFGTRLLVTDIATGRSVVVRVNDRGPFKNGRVIDLSNAAAEYLGIRQEGLARVRLEIYQAPDAGDPLLSGCPFTRLVSG